MSKDPKIYEFTNKEDLIIYLHLLIELVVKHFRRYQFYYKELRQKCNSILKELLDDDTITLDEDNFEEILERIIAEKKMSLNIKTMPYFEYKKIDDELRCTQDIILNILGDRTKKGGASYWRFREEYKKMLDSQMELPQLQEFSEEQRAIINEIYEARNYEHHMTDAKLIEWRQYREGQASSVGRKLIDVFLDGNMIIDVYDNVNIMWLFQLYKTNREFRDDAKRIIQMMKKDYSCLTEKRIQLQFKQSECLGCDNFVVSINGMNRHKGKKK